ncbi:unnamed protein product [Prunus armeniaca]
MGLRQTAGKALLILGILLMWVGLGIMVGHWIFSSMGPFSLLSHANPCVWVPGTGSSSRAPSGLKLTFLEPSMGLVIARSPPCHNLLIRTFVPDSRQVSDTHRVRLKFQSGIWFSTKAQTLSPGTSRSAHIESRSAQVFILEPFLKDVSLYGITLKEESYQRL